MSTSNTDLRRKRPSSPSKQARHLLSRVSSYEHYKAKVKKLIAGGITAKAIQDYSTALLKLQRAQALLQLRNLKSAKLSLYLGQVLAYFGRWEEAETVLLQGQKTNRKPKQALQLSTSLAETYYQAARWADAVVLCKEILDRWSVCQPSLEFYRALALLSNSLEWLEDSTQAEELTQEWLQKLIPRGIYSKRLHRLLQSDLSLRRFHDSENHPALKQAKNRLPSALATACAVERLGSCERPGNPEFALWFYQIACELYLTYFPQSYSCAHCLHRLGDIYKTMDEADVSTQYFYVGLDSWDSSDCDELDPSATSRDNTKGDSPVSLPATASNCYLRSCQLLSSHFPQYLSRLYFDVVSESDIPWLDEQTVLELCELYSIVNPQSPTLVSIHRKLSYHYMEAKEDERVREHTLKAVSLCAQIRPTPLFYLDDLVKLAVYTDSKDQAEAVVVKAYKVGVEMEGSDDILGCLRELY